MSKTIWLVRPPVDEWYVTEQLESLISVAYGLHLISQALKDAIPDIKVRIVDGLNLSVEKVLEKLKDVNSEDFVGVTEVYTQHGNAMSILKYAKSQHAITIAGGPNVTTLAIRILQNNSFVDYAVCEDGEEALSKLFLGDSPKTIPNLVYRDGVKVIKNQIKNAPLTTIISDLGDCQVNLQNFFPLSAIRGCIKVAKSGQRCSFCSIQHSLRVMRAELVWKQIGELHDKYGIKYFFETGDSFIIPGFLSQLLRARPKELEHIIFRGYASPNQLSQEVINTLKELNCVELFLGVESVSDTILKKAKKGYRRKDIELALELMQKNAIGLHIPFMFGLPGETKQSMQEAYELAIMIANQGPINKIIASLAIPLAGSELFLDLANHTEVRRRYKGNLLSDDFFDYRQLVELTFELFTEASISEAQNMINKIKGMSEESTSFGINEK